MYDKALKIALALSAADPKNAQARRDVEYCYESTAGVLAHMNNLTEAERTYRKALAMEEELMAASQGTAKQRADTADAQLLRTISEAWM